MPERVLPGPVHGTDKIREAVCIHTRKIYDSCREKDCIEDLRLFPFLSSLPTIENAVSIRPKSAELLHVHSEVEEVTFNSGYYTIDMRFFYRVTGEAFTMVSRPTEFGGICVFDKRVILFGSEGNAKIFSSRTFCECGPPSKANLPVSVVESVDPIVLSMKLYDVCDCGCPYDCCEFADIPEFIYSNLGEPLAMTGENRRVFVSLGQFSIIRLERDTQLLIPVYDYCLPEKECDCSSDDNPCELFRNINFPVDEFFPPGTLSSTSPADNCR